MFRVEPESANYITLAVNVRKWGEEVLKSSAEVRAVVFAEEFFLDKVKRRAVAPNCRRRTTQINHYDGSQPSVFSRA